MKIGIISDSHDNVANVIKAVDIFKSKQVGLVVHLGDYVSPPIVRLFSGLRLIGVLGNNDGEKLGLMKAFTDVNGEMKGEFGEFEASGLKFACLHGTVKPLLDALVETNAYDFVLYGHDHKLEVKSFGRITAINPGTAHGFGGRATVVVLNTSDRQAGIIDL